MMYPGQDILQILNGSGAVTGRIIAHILRGRYLYTSQMTTRESGHEDSRKGISRGRSKHRCLQGVSMFEK
jgi:hypothetical protein